jgi:transposase-like protein
MMRISINGSQAHSDIGAASVAVGSKPKRRRFSIAEKARIVREADACANGTVGAYLRREGIYSSQLYAWRRERDRGLLDPVATKERAKRQVADEELQKRNHQLEVENRKLQRKIARFELFEEIRKKAAGLLNLEYKSPEFDEND